MRTFFMAKPSPSKRTNHSFACHLREEGKRMTARELDARTTIDAMVVRVKRYYAIVTGALFWESGAFALRQGKHLHDSHACPAVHSLRNRGVSSRREGGDDR